MRVGKLIDKMIDPVLKEAQFNTEHGLLKYTKEDVCAQEDREYRQKVKITFKGYFNLWGHISEPI